jgi:radical SAM protein (TIGR01212 family)
LSAEAQDRCGAAGDVAPYFTIRRFMLETYGAPLHRVPVDFGFGCPHRGAAAGSGARGCAFCAEDGGRSGIIAGAQSLAEQVRVASGFARRRYGAERFLAYVQAHTGTFADPAVLRARLDELAALLPFDAVSIGTRPDCLPDAALDVLADLRRRLDVWVELGVQTLHDATLARIHRGHDGAAARDAIRRAADRGLRVAAHLILGLPGEGPEHFRATADALAALPLFAVKLHNLHVIAGTPLAEMYAREPFPVLDERAYADALIEVLVRLPPRVAVMRIATDTPPERLLAPRWSMDKHAFRAFVVDEMRRRGLRQGAMMRPIAA